MANVFWLSCPECRKRFYAETNMLKIKTKFHCPFCDVYFDKEQVTEEEAEKWRKI